MKMNSFLSMRPRRTRQRGFALVAALLLMMLISALAIGLLMMVNTETVAGGNDLQNNVAYHAAEGGLEKMTADLANVFLSIQAPKKTDIEGVGALVPNTSGITYPEYSVLVTAPLKADGVTIQPFWGTIKSGPNKDLSAQIIPVQLSITAQAKLENQVRMLRTAEIALIPVFQFGVFSDSDLAFFASPTMDFAGRVHTNGDLYLGVSNSATLKFHDKLSAYGNVIRKVLPNGLSSTSFNNMGTVYIPTASAGCSTTTTNCRKIGPYSGGSSNLANEGSVINGPSPAPSHANQNYPTWGNLSTGSTGFKSMLIDGNYGDPANGYGTGAICLTMPFTGGSSKACPTGPGQPPNYTGSMPYEIIRQPPAGEDPTTAVAQSRLYDNAEIRVLLADDPSELPGGAGDPNNIRLANVQTVAGAPDYSNGVPTAVASNMKALGAGQNYVTYFAEASSDVQNPGATTYTATTKCVPADFPYIPKTYGPTDTLGRFTLQNYELLPVSVSDPTAAATLGSGYAPYITNSSLTPAAPPSCFATAAQIAAMAGNSPYTAGPVPATKWNLIDGYLRVEYVGSDGTTHPVTQEWLELGFARDLNPPATPGGNLVNPNAILIFQEPADRNGDGILTTTTPGGVQSSCPGTSCKRGITGPQEVITDSAAQNTSNVASYYYSVYDSSTSTSTNVTRNNWYPINLYDPREGEIRDNLNTLTAGSCAVNGIMNVVELDVGNLKRWLAGSIGTSGSLVENVKDNGYILYFSDRRGMLSNPTAGRKTGDSGLEDTVDVSSSGVTGTPDGVLEPPTTPSGNSSPEDVNLNGVLDNYGAKNEGLAFGPSTDAGSTNANTDINSNSAKPNPYKRIASCINTGRKNWVSGARHALRLVDGSLGNVPVRPDGSGGFTIASENPVYILGNYNSSSADPMWANPSGTEPAHAAASIIADAVTLLSNNWRPTANGGNGGDLASFKNPFGSPTYGSSGTSLRPAATTTYYRVAIAAGKNRTFSSPTWSQTGLLYGFGTDGGVHNFLRFVEDWSNDNAYYKGSLVSLYYSTYATGLFKCCNDSVYHPPNRYYYFDPLFSNPANLPPGTPMFRDVNNLSYRQDFTPR